MLFLISPSESEKQEFTEAVNLHYSFKFVYFLYFQDNSVQVKFISSWICVNSGLPFVLTVNSSFQEF